MSAATGGGAMPSRTLPWLLAALALLAPAAPSRAQEGDGERAYLERCAGCHGARGEGTEWAPAIADAGAAGAHFMMATGRMPLARPDQPVTRSAPHLPPDQIRAISEFVGTLGDGPPIPDIEPSEGDLDEGAAAYLLNCAACHGATGSGGAMVEARNAPSILDVDPLLLAEAVRSGPGPMPVFDEDTLPDPELQSLIRYVLELQDAPTPGGWNLGGWGPVGEGAVGWVLGIALVVTLAVWIERSGRRDEDGGGPG